MREKFVFYLKKKNSKLSISKTVIRFREEIIEIENNSPHKLFSKFLVLAQL